MTDARHCDGPHCQKSVLLDDKEPQEMGTSHADNFIVLTRPGGRWDLHFHEEKCLINWTNSNNRGKVKSGD